MSINYPKTKDNRRNVHQIKGDEFEMMKLVLK